MLFKGLLFNVCLLCLLFFAAAQQKNFLFTHFNRSSGLPTEEVNCIAQDSAGFIWIGSIEGLFRFDGFTYTGFYNKQQDQFSLPGNYINCITVDADGLLWIGTTAGLALMQSDGKIVDVVSSQNNKNFSGFSDNIADIQQKNNQFWISTTDGFFCFSKKNKKAVLQKHYDFKKEFNYTTNIFGPFSFDGDGRIWLCTFHGLVIFDAAKQVLHWKQNNPDKIAALEEATAFESVFIDTADHKLWYSNWQPSVKVLSLDAGKTTPLYVADKQHPVFENMVNVFCRDDHGNIWSATAKGLQYYINASPDSLSVFTHHTSNPYSIGSTDVKYVMQDRSGMIWIGTKSGISITDPYRNAMVNITRYDQDEFPFAMHPVTSLLRVKPNLYLLGTFAADGIYLVDSTFHVQQHYKTGSYRYDWVWDFFPYGNEVFVFSQNGSMLYDIEKNSFAPLLHLPFSPVSSCVSLGDSILYMCAYQNDFIAYRPASKTYKKYSLTSLGQNASILHLSAASDTSLWLIADNKGLLLFDVRKEKIIDSIVKGANGLLQTQVRLVRTAGDLVLIGYVSKGISIYQPSTKKIAHYSHADGLAGNAISDLFVDGNIVWIATSNGISRFDLNKKTFINYNRDNGVIENNIQFITTLHHGRVLAGTVHGILYFDPKKVAVSQTIQAPVVSNIQVQGKNIPVDSAGKDQHLRLHYNSNYISFDYISLSYPANPQIEYAYMLEGHDAAWIIAGNRRFASYSNIKGGHYRFRVKARLPDAEWIESSTPVFFSVATVFYKQWWFYFICLLMAVLIGYGISRYRLQQLMKLEKMRTDISADLHDEVGATLSSISIFSEMARASVDEGTQTEQYLKRIGERSRESIEKMSDIVWSIQPDHDNMDQLITRMKTYASEICDEKYCSMLWKEDENIRRIKLDMQQRKNIYLLFKEALSNAVKYAGATVITIELRCSGNRLYMQIKDDGKGMDITEIKKGNGMKSMPMRAAVLSGKFQLISTPGSGTSIQFDMPL